MQKIKLKEIDTFVYIDASNIRNALKISRVDVDFDLLYKYFQKTYLNLKQIKYFEGVEKTDVEKIESFQILENIGYEMKTLERKSYDNSSKFKTFKCVNCKEKNTVEILKESKTLKSNIDVYLCSEFMGDLLNAQIPVHGIVLTCDGDYAEMIKNLLQKNKNVHVSVFSTPFTRNNNYLSIRLKQLESVDRYVLSNILNIKDKISYGNIKQKK